MTIKAKFPGKCQDCGAAINAGDLIVWAKGAGSRHVTCPAKPAPKNPLSSPPPVRSRTVKVNRTPATCAYCGTHLAAEAGQLWWGEDGCCGDPKHFDEGGWHVTCFDRAECQARVEALRAANQS